MLQYYKDILPAQSVLDQRREDVREEFVQWVAAETSLLSVCGAEKNVIRSEMVQAVFDFQKKVLIS